MRKNKYPPAYPNFFEGFSDDYEAENRQITIDNIINETDIPLKVKPVIRFLPGAPSIGKSFYHIIPQTFNIERFVEVKYNKDGEEKSK